jgi:hypothetical protein
VYLYFISHPSLAGWVSQRAPSYGVSVPALDVMVALMGASASSAAVPVRGLDWKSHRPPPFFLAPQA